MGLARRDPEGVRAALRSRGERHLPDFEELLRLDAEHRRLLAEVEGLRSRRNASSALVGKAKASKNEAEAERLISEVTQIKALMAVQEEALAALSERTRLAAFGVPNPPHESVPPGASDADNPVVRVGPAVRAFDFAPLDHQALGERLGILDFAAAARLSGSRFALWRGAGAKLMRALITSQIESHLQAGYQEIWPPSLVRSEILQGTGQLPKFEADLYRVAAHGAEKGHDLYLIPTAEVPLTNLVREEILEAAALPTRLVAYTPCFRQEAGSYGKDVRGLIRNHQFDKVELVWITRPEDSLAALERLTRDAEEVLKALELPYRVVELCSGELGFASRKSYDLEVWMPSEGRFREISSCSDCGDFQARRMNARLRRGPGKALEFVHTLNGSGVAVGRLFAAILENFQQADGGVLLPESLVPFFGARRIPPPG